MMHNIKIECDKLPKIDVFVDGVNVSNKITSFTLFCKGGSLPVLEVTLPVNGIDISLQGEVEKKCDPY